LHVKVMKSIELKNHNSIGELRRELRDAKDGRYSLRLQCIIPIPKIWFI